MLTGKPSSQFDLWNDHTFSEDSNPYNMVLINTLKQAIMADYVPQVYPGRVTLFTTKEVVGGCYYKPDRGWDALVKQGVDLHEVTGTHLGMLGEPSVQILADKLRVCLEQARADDFEFQPRSTLHAVKNLGL
jgi:thioesterase domain-containing protein